MTQRTHAQIIEDAGGPAAVGDIVGAPGNTTKQWKRNDSIPAPYWAALAEAGKATLEELAAAAAAKRAMSSPTQDAA
jgi:hypothetical protein